MTWGKIDDSLYDHPKLDALGRDRLPGAGLWAVSISWCNRRLTDGYIPTDRVKQLGGSVRLADRLVDVGLFDRAEGGYQVHDFLEFNDSKADVEARREVERIKKRNQRGVGSKAVDHGTDGRFMSPGDTRWDTPRDSRGVSPATRPDPTRPVPEIPPPPTSGGRRKDGTNPRSTGSSPRQNGHAPRDVGESPRQERQREKTGPTRLNDILRRAAAAGNDA